MMAFSDESQQRQLSPRRAALAEDPPPEIEPMPDADVVWAYFDTETGDGVLTLTDDARGVLRLRLDREDHEAVLLALLGAACSGARTCQDADSRAWWGAVARHGEAVLDHMHGVGRLPRVAPEGEG